MLTNIANLRVVDIIEVTVTLGKEDLVSLIRNGQVVGNYKKEKVIVRYDDKRE